MRCAPHSDMTTYPKLEFASFARMKLARLHKILAATTRAIVVGGTLTRSVAIPVAALKFQDMAHLAFQGGFNLCRLAFTPGNATHIGRVNIETPGDSAIKSPQN
jgi:hypothetical protein